MRAGWVAGLSVLVKLAAMLRDMYVARSLGAGAELDGYFVALLLPMFALAVVVQSFSSAFVPTLLHTQHHGGEAAACGLVRGTLTKVLGVLGGLSLALFVGRHWLLARLGWGFTPEQLATTERLFCILLWTVPLSGISIYWGAILNALRAVTVVAVLPAAVPVAALCGLALVPHWGVEALAWGTLAGYAVELIVLAIAMHHRGLPVLPGWDRGEQVAHLARQYGYLVVAAAVMSSSSLIDQAMATMLAPGSVSVLNYGNKLASMLLGTLSLGLSTAAFPYFAQLVARGDRVGIEATLRFLVRPVLLLGIPLTVLLMVGSRPIVTLLFGQGAMAPELLDEIAWVQACYLLQVPLYILGVLASRLLSALGGNRFLLVFSVLNLLVGVVANLLLIGPLGTAGIALSTSCVYLVSCCLLFKALRYQLARLVPRETAPSVLATARAA